MVPIQNLGHSLTIPGRVVEVLCDQLGQVTRILQGRVRPGTFVWYHSMSCVANQGSSTICGHRLRWHIFHKADGWNFHPLGASLEDELLM